MYYLHYDPAAAAAKSLQLCPTLCDPEDHSPPGASIHGILQARVLEWDAIAFSHYDPTLNHNLHFSCHHKTSNFIFNDSFN